MGTASGDFWGSGVNHYDDSGNKVGHTSPGFFSGDYVTRDSSGQVIQRHSVSGDQVTTYDSSGWKVATTSPGFFAGDSVTRDQAGNKIGSSRPGLFGGTVTTGGIFSAGLSGSRSRSSSSSDSDDFEWVLWLVGGIIVLSIALPLAAIYGVYRLTLWGLEKRNVLVGFDVKRKFAAAGITAAIVFLVVVIGLATS